MEGRWEMVYRSREMDVNQGKRVYIMKRDLDRYGYTVGCRGCRSRAEKWNNTANHTAACRARLEREIGEHEPDRLVEAEIRMGVRRENTEDGTEEMTGEDMEGQEEEGRRER